MTAKRLLKKSAKIVGLVIGFVLFIVIIAFIFINTNYGKRFIKDKVVSYLQNKLQTKVSISSIDYSLPKWITLKGVYLEDQHKDTLLYGEEMSVDLNMLRLINGETYIRKIQFKNIYGNVYRNENDTSFNFQFIVNAFAGKKDPNAPVDTTALKLTMKELLLDKVRVNFKDDYGGTSFSASINKMATTLNKFQPDKLQFGIDNFNADSIFLVMTTFKESKKDTSVVAPPSNNLLVTSKNFDVRNLNLIVDDKVTGLYSANDIKHLLLADGNINLNNSKIIANKLQVDSSFIVFVSPKPDPNKIVDTTVASTNWNIALNDLQMKNDHLKSDDNFNPAKEGVDFSHLDLININIAAKRIQYSTDTTIASVTQLAFKDKSNFSIDTTHADITYTKNGISVANLYVKTPNSLIQNALEIKYDDIKQITTAPQNSSVSIKLNNTVIAVNDIYLLMPSIKKMMAPEKFHDNTIALNTQVNGNFQQLNIPYLQMKGLSGSNINAKATLYNVTDSNKLAYDIFIYNTTLQKADIVKFLPDNKKIQVDKIPMAINLNTHLVGTLKKTNATLDISANNFKFAGQADIQNFDKPEALKYDLNIKEGRVTKSFITSFVPASSLPPSLNLPELILLSGTARGDMNNVQTNMKLGGSYGIATVKGTISNMKNTQNAKYDLQLGANGFELGKLMKKDSMIGKISLTASANGRGFDYKTMSADISSTVQSAEFNKYTYQNVEVHAMLNNGNIKTEGNINDPSIKMQYDLGANLKGDYPSNIEGTVLIDTILFNKLNLYKDSLSVAGEMYIKAPSLDPKHLDLYALMDSMRLNVKNKYYLLDSIIAKANTTDSGNTVNLTSPIADIHANGNFEYDKIGQSLLKYIDSHYNITDEPIENVAPQQIAFTGVVKKHPLVSDLVTGLSYDSIHFNGSYASQYGDSALNLTADIPYLQYNTNKVNKGKLVISSRNNAITGDINFDRIDVGQNILYATNIHANAFEDSISIDALTKDKKNVDRFAIGALVAEREKTFTFSLKDNLLLDYKKWNVASDNKITYSPNGILVNNFVLSNNAQKISAISKTNTLNSPVDVSIENFNISDITALLNNDTLLASGTINGMFTLSDFDKNVPAFTGNLSLNKFEFMQQPIGTVKLSANKTDNNTISGTVDLSENGNDVSVKGDYYLNDLQKQFDADINIKSLSVATLQAFSQGNLTRSSGNINGSIALNGKFSDPRWKGSIGFDTTRFTVAKLGTTYSIDKQKIVLDYPLITLDNFTIKDSLNHSVVIDGNVKSNSMMDYDLALDINSNDFILVNSPKAIGNQIYGFAAMDINVSISGNSASPTIEGDLSLTDNSDVTLVLPEQNINKDASRTVVRFIDRDTFALPEKISFSPVVEAPPSFAQFLNYNLNIELSKKAALTIVVDPSTGDELKVQGDAQLNAGVDPGGNIVLVGNYELNKGSYVLHYQFIERQFNLLPNSIITFSGAPMDAQINITAEYIVNTSSKDLLGNEVGETDPKVSNTFNQKIPYRVLLYLKGPMKKPEISFDIQLPDENTAINSQLRSTVENKLTQLRGDVNATNKQVFSLLLLNRFAGEQSSDFFKGSGTDFNELARESVSKFLSSALDQIAGDLFKGVDIDLNVNSYKDYSSGDATQKTDLNVAVSKTFLNDRLTVSVGKNFGIEGQDATASKTQQRTNSSVPDVTVNYKLTEDGKYMLKAYRKDQYEVILDGYVVETGVAFILTLDYDKFKELFRKKK